MEFPSFSVGELERAYRKLGLKKSFSSSHGKKYVLPENPDKYILLPHPHRRGIKKGLQKKIIKELIKLGFTENEILLALRGKRIKRS